MADHYDQNHWHDGLGHTVWFEPKPEHSKLLGPDGNPLPYQKHPFGFDLKPKGKKMTDNIFLEEAQPVMSVEDLANRIHRLARELNQAVTAICAMDVTVSVEMEAFAQQTMMGQKRDTLTVKVSKNL